MTLTREELKAAHNNIMTVMENHIMMLAHCDRTTANLIANEVLDLERELKTLKDDSISKEAFEQMKSKSYQYGYRKVCNKINDMEQEYIVPFVDFCLIIIVHYLFASTIMLIIKVYEYQY